jgi:hypothetical protein
MADGCPKTVADPSFSAQPYLQWFENGQFVAAPYAVSLESRSNGYREGGLWFLAPVPAKRDNAVPNYLMYSAFQETVEGSYMVSSAGAYKGSGARILVRAAFEPPTAQYPEGRIKFTLKADNANAKDYLARDVDGLVLRISEEGNGKYGYEIPVFARRGSGGMVVLDKQDGTSTTDEEVEYWVPSNLKTAPPAAGSNVNLKNAAGKKAAAACSVSATKDASGMVAKWTVSLKIPAMPDGEPYTEAGFALGESLEASWNAGGKHYAKTGATAALEVFAVKSYTAELSDGGKFKTNPANTSYYGTVGGKSYNIEILAGRFVSEETLNKDGPDANGLFKVLEDEELGGLPSYWRRDGETREWMPAAVPVYPETDQAVAALQYAYTGAYLIVCGYGVTPFALDVKASPLGVGIGEIYAKTTVDVETEAPPEFGLKQEAAIRDAALPAMFLTSSAVSPSAVAYINGRLWVAGLPDDPGRVFVSKPNRDRASRTFDFTTYKIFETVTPVLAPFQADNDMNSARLGSVSAGAMGLALEYMRNPVRGKKVSFGFDRPAVLATPYFPSGAEVRSVADGLLLSVPSVPLSGEYTASQAAKLRSSAAYAVGMCRIKVTIPGGFCAVTADCDGFELAIATGTQYVGVVNSVGPQSGFAHLPYSNWGNGAGRVGVIAGAAGAAATLCGGNLLAMAGVGGTCAAILAIAAGTADAVIEGFINSLGLEQTDGGFDNAGLEDLGIEYPTTNAILQKCELLIARNKLYEPKQPFVLRRWKVEESEYSTAECGFTFKAASDEPEGISFIADMRSVFLSTESSERILPATVNGAEQSMQTGSFFGAQRTQPAKAADALYFVRKGGQALMRAAYAPNVPVPQITDAQMYNREILKGRKILGIRSSKAQPPSIWCVMDDGKAAVFAETGGAGAWMRVSSGAGEIIDAGAVPSGGAGMARIVAVRAADGIYIGIASEDLGEKGDVFLDLWSEYANGSVAAQYGPGAAVYDSVTGETVPAEAQPEPGPGKYIGYPYESRFRTLPGNSAMSLSPSRVAAARFRLLESHLPYIKGYPGGMVNRMVHPLWAGSLDVAKDGVVAVPVPGGIEQDAAYEVFTSVPAPLSVVCMIAEED